MPHVVNLAQGATTIPLSASGVKLVQYTPAAPKLNRSGGAYDNTTESLEVLFYGASTSAVLAIVNGIERMLTDADAYQTTRVGNPVYLQFQPIGDATLWRSAVISGRLEYADDSLQAYGQATLPARLYLVREPFWEGARTQIPLTNGNGTNNTAGLTIYNHDDATAGHDNYASIAAASVAGTLPAPVEIRLQNTTGAAAGFLDFHIGNNTFDTALAPLIEGESRANGVGSAVAIGTASNGQVVSVSGAGTWQLRYNVPTTVLQRTAGRTMRLLGRFHSLTGAPDNPVYAQPSIWDYYGLVPLASARETVLGYTTEIQDLGALPMPPGGYSPTASQLVLQLALRMDAFGGAGLDYILLMPADPLYYRRFKQRGMQVNNNDWIVDDGIEGRTYLIESAVEHPIYAAVTGPLHVKPAVDQRLYFAWSGTSNSANWTFKAQAFYRPRRHVF